jgi:hypothetical protein
MLPITRIPQRQGVKTREIFYPNEPTLGVDPITPVGYVMDLLDEAGFGTTRGRTRVPVYKGTRRPDSSVRGNATSDGENPYGMDFRVFPRILKTKLGSMGYYRPGGGTSRLHRLRVPTHPDAEMGSGQVQYESLETPKQIIRNRGVRPGTVNMSYATEGVARYGVGYMGVGDEVETDLGGTIVEYPFKAVSYFNGYAKLDNQFLVGMNEFSLSMDSQLSRQEAAFLDGQAAAIGYGSVNITGRLGLMFSTAGTRPESNLNFYKMAVQERIIPLEMVWANNPLDLATMWCRLIMFVRFGQNSFRPGGSAGKLIAQDYQMEMDENSDHPAEIFASNLGPYTLTGADNVLSVRYGGAAGVPVTLPTGAAVTTDAIVAALNGNATLSTNIDFVNFMGRPMARTKGTGSTYTLQIDTAAGSSAHTVLGFDGVAYAGLDDTGFLWEFYNDISVDL